MNQRLTDLQRKAQKALLDNRLTKKHPIEVLEDDGVVTLKGSVPSRKIKKMAAAILRGMRDINRVVNNLQVNDDHEILERILR